MRPAPPSLGADTERGFKCAGKRLVQCTDANMNVLTLPQAITTIQDRVHVDQRLVREQLTPETTYRFKY